MYDNIDVAVYDHKGNRLKVQEYKINDEYDKTGLKSLLMEIKLKDPFRFDKASLDELESKIGYEILFEGGMMFINGFHNEYKLKHDWNIPNMPFPLCGNILDNHLMYTEYGIVINKKSLDEKLRKYYKEVEGE